jgi:mutator protein MutT
MRVEQRIAVAVVEQDDHFLVGLRPEGSKLAGLWEFPGGKVELGETLSQAAERECAEETGLAVAAERLLLEQRHEYAHAGVHLHFFACCLIASRVLSEPRAPFRWVSRAELATLTFPDGNRELLQRLLREPPAASPRG